MEQKQRTIRVVGETVSIRLGNQSGSQTPLDKDLLSHEFLNLVEYIFKGGNVAQHGEVNKVHGISIQIGLMSAVEAPDETWGKMKEWQDGALAATERPKKK